MTIIQAAIETANSTEATITPDRAFSFITLQNTSANAIEFAIGESIANATTNSRKVTLAAGASLSLDVYGTSLAYQAASASTFTYVMVA